MQYHKVLDATIADGESKSAALDMAGWDHAAIEIPAATSGLATAAVGVIMTGSSEDDGTFRPLYGLLQSGISGFACAVGNVVVSLGTISAYPRYLKVELSANTATAVGFGCKVHVSK